MGTTIYVTDGDWIDTPVTYETVKDALVVGQKPYIEVPGYKGNNYLIPISQITCIEEKLPNNEEKKK